LIIAGFLSSINKQLVGPHKDPPCLKIVAEKMEVPLKYQKKKTKKNLSLIKRKTNKKPVACSL